MKRLIYLLSIFIFSCTPNNENGDKHIRVKEEVQSNIQDVVEEDTMLLEFNTQRYNQGIFDFINSCAKKLKDRGYILANKANTELYKRDQFLDSTFVEIIFDQQFDKGKNQIISFILYQYKDEISAVKLFNELAYHKNQDGIFKSGGLLLHHSKYLLQIAGTCAISKESWNSIREEFQIDLPHLYCICGGECLLDI